MEIFKRFRRLSVRSQIGWIITFSWLILGTIYILWFDFSEFVKLQPNNVGDFFAGFFAPLAFLWLVLGYLQQGEELNQNTEVLTLQKNEINRLATQTEVQAGLLAESVTHAGLQTLMNAYNIISKDLCSLSCIIAGFSTSIDRLGIDKGWSYVSSGDLGYFARYVVHHHDNDAQFNTLKALVRKHPILKSSSVEFINKFKNLYSVAKKFDVTLVIASTIRMSDFSSLSNLLTRLDLIDNSRNDDGESGDRI